MARRRLLTLSLIVVLSALVGCGGGSDDPREHPLVLDWRAGTYQGVRLGDETDRLIRLLGRPERRGRHEPSEPIDEDFYEIGGLTNFSSPDIGRGVDDYETLRYRQRVFGTTGGRVTDWGITDERAETPEGVGVGDSRDIVKRRYPRAGCYTQNEGTEYVTYPICRIRVCSGRLLGFGGDPIKSIWLAAETKRGLKRCSKP